MLALLTQITNQIAFSFMLTDVANVLTDIFWIWHILFSHAQI